MKEDELDSEFAASIAPEGMKCLEQAGFFTKLDDLLCPVDESHTRQSCSGNYKLSEAILSAAAFDAEDMADIFDVLRSRGGSCDCEILYNAVESSRLKAEYWRAQAREYRRASEDVKHWR